MQYIRGETPAFLKRGEKQLFYLHIGRTIVPYALPSVDAQLNFIGAEMKKSIKVCDLETVVLPAGAEGSTKIMTAAMVIIVVYCSR
jgi:hypothetical protein